MDKSDLGSIEDIYIITSPFHKYLKLLNSQVSYFDFTRDDWTYYNDSSVLIPYTPEILSFCEQQAKRYNITIRYHYEYWPRLEEESWRQTNSIRS